MVNSIIQRELHSTKKNYMFVVDENNHRIAEFDENIQFVKPFVSEKKEMVSSTVLVVL
jgi:hypothetical protein